MRTRIERQDDFLRRLNRVMARGLEFDCVLVCPGDGVNFSRKDVTSTMLDASYSLVTSELRSHGIAVPRRFGTAEPMVKRAAGHGYRADETNPNPISVGMTVSPVMRELALGVPVADAQATVLVHPQSGVFCNMSGLWVQLTLGSLTAALALMQSEVEQSGEEFDLKDIWAIMSPGVRGQHFFIDERDYGKFATVGNRFIDGGRIQELDESFQEIGRVKTHRLDLGGLIFDEWKFLGLREYQIFFDSRDSMTFEVDGEFILPSKRRADRAGEPHYASGMFAAVVRRS